MMKNNLNELVMEILSISCSSRASALIVANLAALELVDDGSILDMDILSDQARGLLKTLGVDAE